MRDHPQGRGDIIHIPCEVVFHALVPADLEQCPYIVFTSHGVHRHPPPLPTKTPRPIPKGSYDVGVQKKDRGLTTSKELMFSFSIGSIALTAPPQEQFLESPQLAEFCGQHNASSLAEIHPSFRNTKVIGNLIRKERLKSRQTEDDINGLVRLKETDGDFNVSVSSPSIASCAYIYLRTNLRSIFKRITRMGAIPWCSVLITINSSCYRRCYHSTLTRR